MCIIGQIVVPDILVIKAIVQIDKEEIIMKTIGVLGTGTMGAGIIQVAAQNGYEVVLRARRQTSVDKGIATVEKNLDKMIKKEKITEADKAEIMGRIHGSTDIEIVKDADLIIEAATEDMEAKKALFAELDQLVKPEAIIATNTSSLSITEIAAATNRPDVLDPALLRPGRFDRQVTVALPEQKAREEILKVHARNKILSKNVHLDNIAKRTVGFSGADLENLLNEAALLAVRREKTAITMSEIDEAIDRVIMGPAKVTKKYTKEEKKLVAYHEAGHAVLGIKLDNANDVQKVTIIPRGQAGGYNLMLPKEEKYTATKTELLEQIMGLLGGRVAEEVVFGEITTGAHNDFSKATKIARSMVTEYGMSSLGPVQLETPEGSSFLGRDYNKNRNFSDQVALEIDNEVRKIINDCYSKAKKIIEKNRDLLDLIASNLIEHETLTKEQIDYIAENGKMPVEEMLDDVNLSKLKEMAKAQGIKGYSSMNKDELKKALSSDLSEEEKKDD